MVPPLPARRRCHDVASIEASLPSPPPLRAHHSPRLQGSFGTALLCRTAEPPHSKVVIKRVSMVAMPEDERRSARREADILRHLNHPGILRHIESFEDDGHLCLVTEYCERGDLTTRMAERRGVPLLETTVLDYVVQMALPLLYMHKRKCLHRDLKVRTHAPRSWARARARTALLPPRARHS